MVKNQEEVESKMDGLAGAAGGCSCDKVLQIIARTRLDAPRGPLLVLVSAITLILL